VSLKKILSFIKSTFRVRFNLYEDLPASKYYLLSFFGETFFTFLSRAVRRSFSILYFESHRLYHKYQLIRMFTYINARSRMQVALEGMKY